MKKRMLAIFLAVVMVLSIVPAASAEETATSGTYGDNLTWSFDDLTGTLTITGTGEMQIAERVEVEDAYVYQYPWRAFKDSVTSLVLGEGITSVAVEAFARYENLTQIKWPSTMKKADIAAFYGCGITELRLPEGFETAGMSAFMDCPNLTLIELPTTFYMGSNATFAYNPKLETIIIPEMSNLEFFGEGAFEGNNALTDLDQFTGKAITWGMFYDCLGFTELEIPESVEEIGFAAFSRNANLTKVVMPENLKMLAANVFNECDALKEVWFTGKAPETEEFVFGSLDEEYDYDTRLTLTCYYPEGDASWTEEVRAGFGGDVTWVPYEVKPEITFSDVTEGAWFAKEVKWAVANGITTGMGDGTFAPVATCNRAQVVTFLWRAASSPAPESTENPFVDVPAGQFYTDAVLWAVEKGITSGADETHFNPNGGCSRAQVVTFLHRAAGSPAPESSENPFVDVPGGQFYTDAVLWAVEQGITNGIDSTHFAPHNTCNRAQIVTFLYRANEE